MDDVSPSGVALRRRNAIPDGVARAAGFSRRPVGASHRRGERLSASTGFTLIEVMVVVVIIAVLVTMAGLSMRGDRAGDQMEQEARRMVALLNLLREEAVMRDRDLGLVFTPEGYLFVARQEPAPGDPTDQPAFLPLGDDTVFRPRELPAQTLTRFENTQDRPRPTHTEDERHTPVIQALAADLLFPPGRITLGHPATPRSFVIVVEADGARMELADGRE